MKQNHLATKEYFFVCLEFQNTYNNRNNYILLSQAYTFSGQVKAHPNYHKSRMTGINCISVPTDY